MYIGNKHFLKILLGEILKNFIFSYEILMNVALLNKFFKIIFKPKNLQLSCPFSLYFSIKLSSNSYILKSNNICKNISVYFLYDEI